MGKTNINNSTKLMIEDLMHAYGETKDMDLIEIMFKVVETEVEAHITAALVATATQYSNQKRKS